MTYEIEYPTPIIYTNDLDVFTLAKEYGDEGKQENSIVLSVTHVYHRLCVDYVNWVNWRDRPYIPSDCAGFRLTAMLHEVYSRPLVDSDVILQYVPWV